MKERMVSELDLNILNVLEKEGRISFSEVGERVGLSKTPCWNRVTALKENHSILGYQANLDPAKLGLHIRALVHVVVDFHQYQAFEQAILEHKNVRACHAVTGEFDYVIEILAKDMLAFDTLLRDELSQIPGVTRFNTSLSTRVIKDNSPYTDMLR
jgi:Lrp/AsnC family leucine-responsive transcriptional regulator